MRVNPQRAPIRTGKGKGDTCRRLCFCHAVNCVQISLRGRHVTHKRLLQMYSKEYIRVIHAAETRGKPLSPTGVGSKGGHRPSATPPFGSGVQLLPPTLGGSIQVPGFQGEAMSRPAAPVRSPRTTFLGSLASVGEACWPETALLQRQRQLPLARLSPSLSRFPVLNPPLPS